MMDKHNDFFFRGGRADELFVCQTKMVLGKHVHTLFFFFVALPNQMPVFQWAD